MDNNHTLCVLCCCSFSNTVIKNNGNPKKSAKRDNSKLLSAIHRNKLIDFCDLVDACPAIVGKSSTGREPFGRKNIGKLESNGLSVCSQCQGYVNAALKSRSKSEEMEMTVRNLQMELLKEMKQLASQVNMFYQDMSRIEEIIEGSDVSCLSYHLQEQEGDIKVDGKTDEVFFMRTALVEAVTDLRRHQSQLTKKVNVENHLQEPISDDDKFSGGFDDASEMLESTNYHDKMIKLEVSDDYYMDATIGKVETIVPFDDESSEYVEENGHDSDDGGPVVTSGSKPKSRQINILLKNHQSADTQMSKSYKSKFTFTDEDSFKIQLMEKMSPYKRMVVKRAFKREKYNVCGPDNPTAYPHRMRYDFKQDKLFVGHVQVHVHEKEETLSCSECHLSVKPSSNRTLKQHCDLEKRLQEHIIGSHLEGFKCPVCKLVRTSRTMYLEHLKEEHPGVKDIRQRKMDLVPKPHKCTICQYSTNKPSDLRRHLLVHERRAKTKKI